VSITYMQFVSGYPIKEDYTPASVAVNAGDVVPNGQEMGIAHVDIAVGVLGALSMGGGVYRGPKASGAIGKGVKVYWDQTNNVVTTTSTNNAQLGICSKAAASGDTTVEFLHWPGYSS